jgi:hypothetical protein
MMPDASSLATPLAWALAYAAIGWRVFPIEPGEKRPLGRLVPRGMLDASVDPHVIQQWWKAAPDAGIGIALAPSGLVAIDVDPRNGGIETFEELQSAHGSLRSDVMAFTGGGGEHHVFALPEGMRLRLPGTLGPGVDVKANGYIVVEPSRHPNGKQYAWELSSNPLQGIAPSPLPDWLRSLRVELKTPESVASGPSRPVDPIKFKDLREALYALDADDRDTWLRAGMALHSTGWGQPAYAMWCAWSQQSDKFDATDQRKTWESFRRDDGGITPAWVFAKAAETGWVNPRARVLEEVPVGDWTSEIPPEGAESVRKPSIRLLDYDALLAQHAQQRWLVKKAIPCNALGMLFGGSGTYKTFVALDLALRVAHGMQWLGRKTMSGDVVYLAAEGGTGICDRMTAWYRVHKDRRPTPSLRVIPQTINLSEDASEVKAAIEAAGISPCLIVIDTMSQTSAAEENSATETAHYLRELGAMLRDVWQCCVLIIHHTGHGATERPRGSSALRSNIDFLLGLFLDGDGSEMCTLTCDKQKDGERFKDESLRVVKVEIGHDEDGDVIDSMVAFWVDNGSELRDAVRHERERGKRGYLATLCDLAQDGMEAEELRKKFYDACGLDKSDSRRRTFNRTIEKAAKANLVAIVDEKVRVFSKV